VPAARPVDLPSVVGAPEAPAAAPGPGQSDAELDRAMRLHLSLSR
jgi:hypothetical protein